MKGTLSALLLVTTFISHTATAGVNVSVTVLTTQVVSFIDELFIGVTLDSHLLPASANWGGLDFNSQKVQALAKGLSPCYLRIGGTGGDNLTFDPTGHGTTDVNHTFTGASWNAVNTFVQDVNWKLIFGLNALKRKDGHWDPTNAKELLQYNSAKGYQLAGLELGNEPDIFPEQLRRLMFMLLIPELSGPDPIIYRPPPYRWNIAECGIKLNETHSLTTEADLFPGTYNITVSPSQLGMDFNNFKKLLRSTPGYETTPVIGPDVAYVTVSKSQFFADFFAAGGGRALDRITFHHYYTNGHTAQLPNFTDSKLMDTLVSTIQTALDVSRRTNPLTPVWLGETSSCYYGGAPGMSDRYVAGFLWLDKLGIAARMGLKAVLRQDFYLDNYPLIDTDTFDPLPDYWLTVLYKRLVGGSVFSVEASVENSTIRAYAHCTKPSISYGYMPGSVTMYFLLPTDNTASITFPQFPNQPVDVFWLTPINGLTSKTVALNNNPLKLVNNTLPELKPYRTETNTVTFPGKSFGFLVFPEADVAACSSQ